MIDAANDAPSVDHPFILQNKEMLATCMQACLDGLALWGKSIGVSVIEADKLDHEPELVVTIKVASGTIDFVQAHQSKVHLAALAADVVKLTKQSIMKAGRVAKTGDTIIVLTQGFLRGGKHGQSATKASIALGLGLTHDHLPNNVESDAQRMAMAITLTVDGMPEELAEHGQVVAWVAIAQRLFNWTTERATDALHACMARKLVRFEADALDSDWVSCTWSAAPSTEDGCLISNGECNDGRWVEHDSPTVGMSKDHGLCPNCNGAGKVPPGDADPAAEGSALALDGAALYGSTDMPADSKHPPCVVCGGDSEGYGTQAPDGYPTPTADVCRGCMKSNRFNRWALAWKPDADPAAEGSGLYASTDAANRVCDACNGSGQVVEGDPCLECEGAGVVSDPETGNPVDCDVCEGVAYACPVCSGTGSV